MTNYWKKKTVVITGASGFVGSAIADNLEQKGAKVIKLSRSLGSDILDYQVLKKKTKNVDMIFHCAALDGNSEFKKDNSAEILETNIRLTANVLKSVRRNKIPFLVYISSADIYPPKKNKPIFEHDDYRKNHDFTEDGYVLSKRVSEIMAQQFAKKFNFKLLIARPNNIYGSLDKKKRLISILIEKIKNDQPVTLYGNGSSKRNFIFINDFCSIVIKLAEKQYDGVLNIASNEVVTLKDLTSIIAAVLGKKPKIVYKKVSASLLRDQILDLTKLSSLLDFQFTSMEDGLSTVINGKNKSKL